MMGTAAGGGLSGGGYQVSSLHTCGETTSSPVQGGKLDQSIMERSYGEVHAS